MLFFIIIIESIVVVVIILLMKVGLTNLRELEFFFVLSFTFSFTEMIWVLVLEIGK